MKVNYIVNYGVTARHLFENKTFEFYRDAVKFYNDLDREKWGAGNVVKLETDGSPYDPPKVIKKLEYIVI